MVIRRAFWNTKNHSLAGTSKKDAISVNEVRLTVGLLDFIPFVTAVELKEIPTLWCITQIAIPYHKISVAMAKRSHPFPSRTRKLSSSAPMVLRGKPRGRVGRRRSITKPPSLNEAGRLFLRLPMNRFSF